MSCDICEPNLGASHLLAEFKFCFIFYILFFMQKHQLTRRIILQSGILPILRIIPATINEALSLFFYFCFRIFIHKKASYMLAFLLMLSVIYYIHKKLFSIFKNLSNYFTFYILI